MDAGGRAMQEQLPRHEDHEVLPRSHALRLSLYTNISKHVIPAGIAGIQKPWMAMSKQTTSLAKKGGLSEIKHSHPYALDSGTNLFGTDLH
jgi:hypothetical protein